MRRGGARRAKGNDGADGAGVRDHVVLTIGGRTGSKVASTRKICDGALVWHSTSEKSKKDRPRSSDLDLSSRNNTSEDVVVAVDL